MTAHDVAAADAEMLEQRALAPALRRLLSWGPLVLAFLGMGISAYLSYVHFSGVPVFCRGSAGCHAVQSSEYATMLGVPVSLLGFLLYSGIFATGLVAVAGRGRTADVAPVLVFGMALAGVLFSGYLTWLELYRIYAICTWCVISASLLAAIFVCATTDLMVSERWQGGDDQMD